MICIHITSHSFTTFYKHMAYIIKIPITNPEIVRNVLKQVKTYNHTILLCITLINKQKLHNCIWLCKQEVTLRLPLKAVWDEEAAISLSINIYICKYICIIIPISLLTLAGNWASQVLNPSRRGDSWLARVGLWL